MKKILFPSLSISLLAFQAFSNPLCGKDSNSINLSNQEIGDNIIFINQQEVEKRKKQIQMSVDTNTKKYFLNESEKNVFVELLCEYLASPELISKNMGFFEINSLVSEISSFVRAPYFKEAFEITNAFFKIKKDTGCHFYSKILKFFLIFGPDYSEELFQLLMVTNCHGEFLLSDNAAEVFKKFVINYRDRIPNLQNWESVFGLINHYNLDSAIYFRFLAFVLENNNTPSPNLLSYLDLILGDQAQDKATDLEYDQKKKIALNQLVEEIIGSSERGLIAAYPRVKQILDLFPNLMLASRQSVAAYTLMTAESMEFQERLNYVCQYVNPENWTHIEFMKYLNSVYQMNEESFNKLKEIVYALESFYPAFMSFPCAQYIRITSDLCSREDHVVMIEAIKSEWANVENKSQENFIKTFETITTLEKIEGDLVKKLEHVYLLDCNEIVSTRRELIKITQKNFDLLPYAQKILKLDEFRGKRLQILMQFPINEDEIECLNDLNASDELFFQQISSFTSCDDLKTAIENYKNTRKALHLAIARSDAEYGAISIDEEEEAKLIDLDAQQIFSKIAQEEEAFKTSLEEKLADFIVMNIRDCQLSNLTREAFLDQFNKGRFSEDFVQKCLDEYDDSKKFEVGRKAVFLLQKEKATNLLKNLLKKNFCLTVDVFLDICTQNDIPREIAQTIWDEKAEDLRSLFSQTLVKEDGNIVVGAQERDADKVRRKRLERFQNQR